MKFYFIFIKQEITNKQMNQNHWIKMLVEPSLNRGFLKATLARHIGHEFSLSNHTQTQS